MTDPQQHLTLILDIYITGKLMLPLGHPFINLPMHFMLTNKTSDWVVPADVLTSFIQLVPKASQGKTTYKERYNNTKMS